MLSVLVFSFNAIAPILLLILLGWYGRRAGMLDGPMLKKLNRFNFRFGFFSLMFTNLCEMELDAGLPWGLMGFVLLSMVVLTVWGGLAAKFLTRERRRVPVLMMAAFRSNYAIIGLVLAEALAGPAGAETVTLLQLPTVLYFNIMSTALLALYGGKGLDMRRMFQELRTNPLILGLLAGGAAAFLRIPLNAAGEPLFAVERDLPWLYTTLSYLGRMAMPVALVVLGGQLELKEAAGFRRELIGGVALRLVAAPVIGFALAWAAWRAGWFTLNAARYTMLTAAYATPMAVASVVMSAEMGADDQLCGQIVVWSSILSLPTMFLITSFLRAMGLI